MAVSVFRVVLSLPSGSACYAKKQPSSSSLSIENSYLHGSHALLCDDYRYISQSILSNSSKHIPVYTPHPSAVMLAHCCMMDLCVLRPVILAITMLYDGPVCPPSRDTTLLYGRSVCPPSRDTSYHTAV